MGHEWDVEINPQCVKCSVCGQLSVRDSNGSVPEREYWLTVAGTEKRYVIVPCDIMIAKHVMWA